MRKSGKNLMMDTKVQEAIERIVRLETQVEAVLAPLQERLGRIEETVVALQQTTIRLESHLSKLQAVREAEAQGRNRTDRWSLVILGGIAAAVAAMTLKQFLG